MKDINETDASILATMIYETDFAEIWEGVPEEPNGNYKMSEFITKLEQNLNKSHSKTDYGAEMTKEEFQDVIEQIKSSETLMSIEIENYVDNSNTQLRAMTLVDLNEEIKPVSNCFPGYSRGLPVG